MSAITRIASLTVLFGLGSCIGKPFQPTPPAFTQWERAGAADGEIIEAMMACGYPNIEGFSGTQTPRNYIAKVEQCMFRKGFKYKDGWMGMCSLKSVPPLSACSE